MKKIDMIVKAEHMYTLEGAGVGYKESHALAVDRGKIIAVGSMKLRMSIRPTKSLTARIM